MSQPRLGAEIDGRTWRSVPDSWLDQGEHHRPDSGAARRYATLAATDDGDVLVRYIHPTNSGALVIRFDGVDVNTGLIPKPLCRHSQDWPKSITRDPWADLERPGAVRHGERDLLWELHGEFLEDETAYQREEEATLVTDGGQCGSVTAHYDEYEFAVACKSCGVVDWVILTREQATQDAPPIEDDPGKNHYERTGHTVARLNYTTSPPDIREMVDGGGVDDLDWGRIGDWLANQNRSVDTATEYQEGR